MPRSGWMNDPNGAIHWRGVYHLFYQHNPDHPVWGNIHWGHATSRDLIHWEHHPIALAPSTGADETGCFSGCAVDHDGVPTLIYTGVQRDDYTVQTQCIATPHDDNLITWEKYAGNPVLADVPPEMGQTADFRDPYVWRSGEVWYMVLASRIQDEGGAVLLYRSRDLYTWDYVHPLLVNADRANEIWECPNFFPLGDRWVLIISYGSGGKTAVRAYVGTFANDIFTPLTETVIERGLLYAPLIMRDAHNRALMFGWIRESCGEAESRLAGYAGAASVVRVLSIDAQDRLCMTPIPELDALRGERLEMPAHGHSLDIHATFADSSGTVGIAVACSSEDQQRTEITYHADSHTLRVRTLHGDTEISAHSAIHVLDSEESLELRVLRDHSLIEVIANERVGIAHRTYADADASQVRVIGDAAQVQHIDIYAIASIWQ
jgi:beta-fructofuranosidase